MTAAPARRLGFWARVRDRLSKNRFGRLRRPLWLLARGALLVAATAGAVSAGRLLERYVRSAKAFETHELQVTGMARLSRDEILKQAGLALGKNVFEVSPEQAQARLVQHPWIVEASVVRRLPSSYRIELREQTTAALLLLERLYLVGEDGTVFKALDAGDPVDLPVITGVDPSEFRSDLALRSGLLLSAVGLLHDYRDAGLFRREPIAEIHVEADRSLSLYVGKDTTLVRLGQRPYRKKLQRLRGILDELRKDAARPAYVYLDNVRRPDRATVRVR